MYIVINVRREAMKAIWKFTIDKIEKEVVISMPTGAKILAVQVQEGVPCIWAVVEPDAPKKERVFEIKGTGHLFSTYSDLDYVGTFQLQDGTFVGHLFDKGERDET